MNRLARTSRVLPIVVVLGPVLVGLGSGSEPAQPTRPGDGKGPAPLLEIRGEIPRPLAWSREEFARLPRRSVRARAHDGIEAEYEGVVLAEILSRAGVPSGTELRGKALTLHAVVEAADGYRTLFALPELDPGYTDRVLLLADRRDGRPLSDREGPLQVIVPGEKKHARWVRQVVRLVIGRG